MRQAFVSKKNYRKPKIALYNILPRSLVSITKNLSTKCDLYTNFLYAIYGKKTTLLPINLAFIKRNKKENIQKLQGNE